VTPAIQHSHTIQIIFLTKVTGARRGAEGSHAVSQGSSSQVASSRDLGSKKVFFHNLVRLGWEKSDSQSKVGDGFVFYENLGLKICFTS
jgi:hypothetical protein